MDEQTVKLLKECNSGCKAAVDSIDQLTVHIKRKDLKDLVNDTKKRHTDLGERCRAELGKCGKGECDPPAVGMAMAHIGTSIKLAVDSTDKHIADMLADGAVMGMKSISQVMNLYPDASSESRQIAHELVEEESGFLNKLLLYV